MNRTKRYDWEDSLIAAEVAGTLPAGAVNVALRLSKAINWTPKDHRPAGLYWKNSHALDAVGVSRATFYRYNEVLKEHGFLVLKGHNLLPTIPESQIETAVSQSETVEESQSETEESQIETKLSQIETEVSQIETEVSQFEHPLSVVFSEDVLSEEVCSESATAGAEAHEEETLEETQASNPSPQEPTGSSSVSTLSSPASERSEDAVKRVRESQIETPDNTQDEVKSAGESQIETFKTWEYPKHFTKGMRETARVAFLRRGIGSWANALDYAEKEAAAWEPKATNIDEEGATND